VLLGGIVMRRRIGMLFALLRSAVVLKRRTAAAT
jgi:hypothetical protein